jgi:hypothetical protein
MGVVRVRSGAGLGGQTKNPAAHRVAKRRGRNREEATPDDTTFAADVYIPLEKLFSAKPGMPETTNT